MPDISFQIKLITPTFNFGAKDREPDSTGLRATSLRGLWRFWARAIIAGALSPSSSDKLRILEDGLFGGTEPPFKTLRLRLVTDGYLSREQYRPVPHKEPPWSWLGWDPENVVKAHITLNQGLSSFKQKLLDQCESGQASKIPEWNAPSRKALLSVLWLWGNLGGTGIRSRRGFGSVALGTSEGQQDPFEEAGLPSCCETFESVEALSKHLKDGIEKSFDLVRDWINNWTTFPVKAGLETHRSLHRNRDMYELSSLAQVFVSNTEPSCDLGSRDDAPTGLLWTIGDKPEVRDETGSANPRLASPMIVRVHQVKNSEAIIGYCPVLTWSPQTNTAAQRPGGNANWLRALGIETSLGGDSIYV